MIVMRLREVTSCPQHHQTIVVLEDMTLCRTLAIAVDVDESQRLVREVSRPPDGRRPTLSSRARPMAA